MFEQAQRIRQNADESGDNSFMHVLSDYEVPNKSNEQSPFIIKTGFHEDNSGRSGFSKSNFDTLAYNACISVTYGTSTFNVMMHPDKNGKSMFDRPQGLPRLQSQTTVSQKGAKDALEAMAKYIEKNKGKKYGSFFGLMRNSNSFVKYVLKHTHDGHAKILGKLHSTFTAERAADKVFTNNNKAIAVEDLRFSQPQLSESPAEGEHPIAWLANNSQFAYMFERYPTLLEPLSELYNLKRADYTNPCDAQVHALNKLLNTDRLSQIDIKSFLGYVHSYGWLDIETLSRILNISESDTYKFLKSEDKLNEAEKDIEIRNYESSHSSASEPSKEEKIRQYAAEAEATALVTPKSTTQTPTESSSSKNNRPNYVTKYYDAVQFDNDFKKYTKNPEVEKVMLSFANAKSGNTELGESIGSLQVRLGQMLKGGQVDQKFLNNAKKNNLLSDNDINYINAHATGDISKLFPSAK